MTTESLAPNTLSTLSHKSETVAEFGDSRRFLRQSHFLRQYGQGLNDVTSGPWLRGCGLKLSRDSDRESVTADTIINSTVLLAVFCQLLSQTKPMREEGPGDTADV